MINSIKMNKERIGSRKSRNINSIPSDKLAQILYGIYPEELAKETFENLQSHGWLFADMEDIINACE